MNAIKNTADKKKQFDQHVDNAMRDYFQEDLKNYIGGRTRFLLSVLAVLFFIMLGVNTAFPVIAPVSAIIIWIAYVLGNNYTRFFVTHIFKMKNKISYLINQLLKQTSIPLRYSNQKEDSIKKDIKALKLFTKYSGNVGYRYHNTLTGSLDGIPVTIGNIDVIYSRGESASRELFGGSVYVIPLEINENYYLRVTPERLHKKKAEVKLRGMDMTTLFKNKNRDENKKDIDYYDIASNGDYATSIIMDEHITNLFKRPIQARDFDFKKIMQTRGQSLTEKGNEVKERLHEHQIEILVIKDSKAYIFFPFKYKGTNQKFPFDIATRKDIEPEYLWNNMQDIIEKTPTLHQLIKNTQNI